MATLGKLSVACFNVITSCAHLRITSEPTETIINL